MFQVGFIYRQGVCKMMYEYINKWVSKWTNEYNILKVKFTTLKKRLTVIVATVKNNVINIHMYLLVKAEVLLVFIDSLENNSN